VFLILSVAAMAQVGQNPVVSSGYLNSTLGFRYIPPREMKDKTERVRKDIKEEAGALHTSNTLDLLLAMSSDPDDAAPDWYKRRSKNRPHYAAEAA